MAEDGESPVNNIIETKKVEGVDGTDRFVPVWWEKGDILPPPQIAAPPEKKEVQIAPQKAAKRIDTKAWTGGLPHTSRSSGLKIIRGRRP